LARSPCSAAPSIRFLSIGSQLRSTLPPCCGSLYFTATVAR
jgi:hypothetical protein